MTSLDLRRSAVILALGQILVTAPFPLAAQTPPHVAMERAGYLAWLRDAANSPLFAVAQRPVGTGLRLGPSDADIPLEGVAEQRLIVDRGIVLLEGRNEKEQGGDGRSFRLGSYRLFVGASPSGPVVTVFGPPSGKQPPGYYPYHSSLVFIGPMLPPEQAGKVRVLGADGIEVEGTEAGAVIVPLGGTTRLRVLRIPLGGEESELEIFFRDGSNGDGTYPAGRFVSLVPAGNGKFRLDFNTARNPFCAYSPAYACPVPWRGNVITTPIRAGERYQGGGLEAPPAGVDTK
jgi:Protein of unknown function (DUF1684)